ncbi:hypothetical protein EOD41_03775 [Mucilaginibacter limnophilus]|uniref:Uncharacterized protein n=1 Tax=Mucilaginibacter limnophilus TaxID=1932778 RepID=A0A3S3TKE5_9SPHI|nr:hypothetical protein [Mucilaginibacter limnophilus]RVU03063.1 hypothetical protein EOD41_03775 [Mucilaginibacter limnophilus]
MKKENDFKSSGNFQGSSTADRAFNNLREDTKSKGISNGGGQRSDQTSNRDNNRKHDNKKS